MKARMKSLAAISRIRDRDLQERSTELNSMRADLRRIDRVREDLDRARREECRVSLPEALPYVANFLDAIGAEDVRAAQAQRTMADLIEVKREEVVSAWRGVRAIDQVRDQVAASLRRAIAQAESIETDERNIIAYGRARQQMAA